MSMKILCVGVKVMYLAPFCEHPSKNNAIGKADYEQERAAYGGSCGNE